MSISLDSSTAVQICNDLIADINTRLQRSPSNAFLHEILDALNDNVVTSTEPAAEPVAGANVPVNTYAPAELGDIVIVRKTVNSYNSDHCFAKVEFIHPDGRFTSWNNGRYNGADGYITLEEWCNNPSNVNRLVDVL